MTFGDRPGTRRSLQGSCPTGCTPRRRLVLDYSPPELPPQAPLTPGEILTSSIAALLALVVAWAIPRLIPDPLTDTISGYHEFLTLSGAIISHPYFAPLAALATGISFLAVVAYQRHNLRNIRHGKP